MWVLHEFVDLLTCKFGSILSVLNHQCTHIQTVENILNLSVTQSFIRYPTAILLHEIFAVCVHKYVHVVSVLYKVNEALFGHTTCGPQKSRHTYRDSQTTV